MDPPRTGSGRRGLDGRVGLLHETKIRFDVPCPAPHNKGGAGEAYTRPSTVHPERSVWVLRMPGTGNAAMDPGGHSGSTQPPAPSRDQPGPNPLVAEPANQPPYVLGAPASQNLHDHHVSIPRKDDILEPGPSEHRPEQLWQGAPARAGRVPRDLPPALGAQDCRPGSPTSLASAQASQASERHRMRIFHARRSSMLEAL